MCSSYMYQVLLFVSSPFLCLPSALSFLVLCRESRVGRVNGLSVDKTRPLSKQ